MSGTLAHPRNKTVEVNGGEAKVTVRKWKMRERAELRPRVVKLFEQVLANDGKAVSLELMPLFLSAEEEVAEIVKFSCTMPEGLEWDDLDWEDLPVLAQAVWELNVVGPDKGGLVGKTFGLIQPLMSSPQPTESEQSGPDSSSSPDAGEALQNGS